jgi:hypothetical protein
MTKRDTAADKVPLNMLINAINGRECMMMLSNMSSHARNVRNGPEFGTKNLFILLGQ